MAFQLIALVCVLLATGTFARSTRHQEETNLQYDFNAHGTRRHENVELNREENYVRIYSPATDKQGDMTLIHDYNKGMTLCKTASYCFILGDYQGFYAGIDDWQNAAPAGPVEPQQEKVLNYQLAPFTLNRTTLAPVMQRECSDEVYLAIPKTGEEADDNNSAMIQGSVVIPTKGSAHEGGRVKRNSYEELRDLQRQAEEALGGMGGVSTNDLDNLFPGASDDFKKLYQNYASPAPPLTYATGCCHCCQPLAFDCANV